MAVDTHTHLYLSEFADTPNGPVEAVDRAVLAGVEMMIMPNVGLGTIEPMRALHTARPDVTRKAMGLHPTEVGTDWEQQLQTIFAELDWHRNDYVAIGEVGIDLYWDKTFRSEQRLAFARQVLRGAELGLPIIIHCREGLDDTLDVLDMVGSEVALSPQVFHSFTGTPDDVERIRTVVPHAWFGINGVVTFKNSNLRDTLPAIGLDSLLLETDSPYLAPVPHRGRRNESAYVIDTAAYIAQHLGVSLEALDEATTANAREVFKF